LRQNRIQRIEIPIAGFASPRSGTVLALGPELKANYCVLDGARATVYSGFGDLKNPLCYGAYKRSLLSVLRKQKKRPGCIAHDLNPVFLSSRLAQELHQGILPKSTVVPVQHHFAHVGAALAALSLGDKPVLGVACDGTGLGDNATVWGCEFIVRGTKGFTRVGHLDPMALPGGDKAVEQPWRVAAALLYRAFGARFYSLPVPWLKKKKREILFVRKMIDAGVNTPYASSAGRLFDGVAALIGVCLQVDEEAQAARMLEQKAAAAAGQGKKNYRCRIGKKNGMFVIDIREMIRDIVSDLRARERGENIAMRFHAAFSDSIVAVCRKLRVKTGIGDVVLCGGVFFNAIVGMFVEQGLKKQGFVVHKPPAMFLGDTGLSLGQAVIANVSGNTGKNRKN